MAHPDEGATSIEYGLIVGLVAVVILTSVALLGSRLHVLFVTINRMMPR